MKVELIESVDEFIAVTTTFRASDPLRTNVIGSVSLAVSTGGTTYDDYHWWIVRGDDGDVVGVAMRTSPFNMIIAPMPINAARALGRSVGDFDDALPGLAGSRDIVDAFIEGYVESKSHGSTRVLAEERRDLLYALEELITPDVEGLGRPARTEEIDALTEMFAQFWREVEGAPLSPADARNGVKRAVTAGSLFCWELAGDIVAIAGHAPIITTEAIAIGRIGPVFTPPEFRRRGFGSAVTALVTRRLIEKGARVMLFTDAANPTSNDIYQAIGYRLVDEVVQMHFE
jgi:predicted GNAT family acetyltransferase